MVSLTLNMINTHNVLKLSQTLKSGLFCLLTNATRLTVARKWSDQHFPTNRPLLWSQLPPVFFPGFSVSFSKISTISHQKLSRNVLKLWVCKEHRDCVCSVWCIVHRVRILRRFRIDWQKSCDIWPSAGKTTLLSISTYHQNCLWLPPKRAPMSKGSLEYHHQLVTVFKAISWRDRIDGLWLLSNLWMTLAINFNPQPRLCWPAASDKGGSSR